MSQSNFEYPIKTTLDPETQEEKFSTSPLTTSRTRSSFSSSSASSTCLSNTTSSFEFTLCEEIQNCKPEIFSPAKQCKQQTSFNFNPQTVPKNFGTYY